MRRPWVALAAVLASVPTTDLVHTVKAQQGGTVTTQQPATTAVQRPATPAIVAAILSALRVVEQKPLWPGFELHRVPVATFDGQRTFLFRHPASPAEFVPVPGAEGLRAPAGPPAPAPPPSTSLACS